MSNAIRRRTFLTSAASAGLAAAPAPAADAVLEIHPGELGPEISRHLYGQFIEHLGGVIYDGIWVGPDSRAPNLGGIRKQFIDDMKRIGAPNFRWPGGCFADSYHWRDGIGPRRQRPRTYNLWQTRMPEGVDATETNQFGTDEFTALCRLVGAEPYITANVGSGSPREFHEWVMYANAPVGTVSLADLRAKHGHPEPYHVRYWGVGNEAWGCGGNFSPAEYATEFRRFVTRFPTHYGRPFLVAVGPSGGRPDGHLGWTRGFFEAMRGHARGAWPAGWALHYYTRPRRSPKADANSPQRWYDILQAGARMEWLIEEHWKTMGEFDPEHRVRFVIDEWGVWQPRTDQLGGHYILTQVGNLRDALHAALTLDIFNRHAEKIAMANIAQTINCLHSLFEAKGERFARTPTYYVFEMYGLHMGAKRVPLRIDAPDLKVPVGDGSEPLFCLAGSASVRDRRLALTLVNPSIDDDVIARIDLRGARAREARGRVLTHGDPWAANSLAAPDTVKPAAFPVDASAAPLRVRVPKHSVAAIELRLV